MSRLLIVAALIAMPVLAKSPLVDVSLVWKPTRSTTEMGMTSINLLPFQGKQIAMTPFTDARPDPARIGENRENPAKPLPVTTKDRVPEWVTGQTLTFLTSLGLPMVKGEAAVVLSGEVMSFFVTEGEHYLGDVRIRIKVCKNGKPIWSGLAIGADKRFGRSYKLDNYQETLTESLQEAWVNLTRNPEFLSALAQ